jgi:hypothetical protein
VENMVSADDGLWLMVETDDGLWNMDAVEGAE